MSMIKAIRNDILKIGDLELRVAILEDGKRIIEAESLEKFFENLVDIDLGEDDVREIAKFIHGKE